MSGRGCAKGGEVQEAFPGDVEEAGRINRYTWGGQSVRSFYLIMSSQTFSPTIYLRDIPINKDAVLAPMDGYSDWRADRMEMGTFLYAGDSMLEYEVTFH